HETQILETSRAAVPLHDLLDRTPEVDVDELGREDVGDEGRGLTHRDRIGAEDLDADGPLVGAEAKLGRRRRIFTPDALGGEELGDDDGSAKAAAESTEWRFRDSCHWREIQRDVDPERKRKPLHSFKLRECRSASNISI